jgi:hypothetical protein
MRLAIPLLCVILICTGCFDDGEDPTIQVRVINHTDQTITVRYVTPHGADNLSRIAPGGHLDFPSTGGEVKADYNHIIHYYSIGDDPSVRIHVYAADFIPPLPFADG